LIIFYEVKCAQRTLLFLRVATCRGTSLFLFSYYFRYCRRALLLFMKSRIRSLGKQRCDFFLHFPGRVCEAAGCARGCACGRACAFRVGFRALSAGEMRKRTRRREWGGGCDLSFSLLFTCFFVMLQCLQASRSNKK
jgi:hypothetical protein